MSRQPRKCAECRQRAVIRETLGTYSEDMAHDGRTYHVSVENFDVLRCQNCSAMIFDDAANDRLAAALRETVGLLSPEEIRARREALGLSQQRLADLMCVAVATISRWENGAQIQQRSMNRFLEILFCMPEVRTRYSSDAPTNIPAAATLQAL